MTGWVDLTRRVEDLGYSVLNHGDHIGFMGPIAAMTAAAMATSTLRVGSLVFCNDYRHPVFLAQEAATLDGLSAGRFEFGLGAGWEPRDYTTTGITMDTPGARIARLAEAVVITKRFFAGDPFSFEGRYYDVRDVVGRPRPVQSPRPPIVLGGGGRQMLTLAAQEADIVTLNIVLRTGDMSADRGASASASQVAERVALVRHVAGARFDDIELGLYVHFCKVTDDPAGAARELAPAMHMDPDDVLASPHVLVGSHQQIAGKMQRLRDDYDLSYVSIDSVSTEELAPVVERLSGT
jgi:probable F420-dependent oxidoreductase